MAGVPRLFMSLCPSDLSSVRDGFREVRNEVDLWLRVKFCWRRLRFWVYCVISPEIGLAQQHRTSTVQCVSNLAVIARKLQATV